MSFLIEKAGHRHSGEVISGHCRSTPEFRSDGGVDLREEWERYGAHGSTGGGLLQSAVGVFASAGVDVSVNNNAESVPRIRLAREE